ncbi:hypothetical protein BDQ12DRAFT_391767 [Crucibulum laeve]|uniref:Uncharacterized protein n=1 Tax=Crucibulum laeve TaxID=68775 RepID=A0A5C3M8I3_9AGAR|nr:hypothetical protein BDQ12DRAFT_391767 [Crucibulum laeve]
MLPRSPTLATTMMICLTILALFCQLVLGQAAPPNGESIAHPHPPPPLHKGNDTQTHLVCTVFGVCEPCPEEDLDKPICQPFGNRRLMHCQNITASGPLPEHNSPFDHTQHPEGEALAWESCGRIVPQERADFFEFIGCNVLFAAISLVVLFARSKRLQAMQARQLAARIGLVRGNGGGRR